ncbi:hypothetical protein AHiyo8_16940 [Arthrobacter sp. Hiyo8]|nr:hypothetical protein AHiyo8_16940 [Arthrobacter sp. Hiyo8]
MRYAVDDRARGICGIDGKPRHQMGQRPKRSADVRGAVEVQDVSLWSEPGLNRTAKVALPTPGAPTTTTPYKDGSPSASITVF